MTMYDAQARHEALEMHQAMLEMSLYGIEHYHKVTGRNDYETLERKVSSDLRRARKDRTRAYYKVMGTFFGLSNPEFQEMDPEEVASILGGSRAKS